MGELIYICELCQTVLDDRGSKQVCPNCGRTFDCSDLPVVTANAELRDDNLVLAPKSDLRDLLPKAPPPGTLIRPDTGIDEESA